MPAPEEITRHHDPDPAENPWVHGPPAPETVAIVAYDPEWSARYRALAADIVAALGEVSLGIEHVGLTAVVGLAAKDVVDINLTVPATGGSSRGSPHGDHEELSGSRKVDGSRTERTSRQSTVPSGLRISSSSAIPVRPLPPASA
ncbi:GrpB protein [Actinopolyspora mzabensis]|uniref:GrpB protein n=1 Tax=Actinopolyspora mzabensis TaxID=995066 RepID=A0A1G8WX54_ACTMZ|nr:GrpB family protein [Actinopolyspora mzabensis]SDJ82781.1 GrpB protein [Actinopolyspora mzabensis]